MDGLHIFTLGILVFIYGGFSLFSLVWLFASDRLTWLKPRPWLDVVVNAHGAFTLLTLLLGQVAGLFWLLGWLLMSAWRH